MKITVKQLKSIIKETLNEVKKDRKHRYKVGDLIRAQSNGDIHLIQDVFFSEDRDAWMYKLSSIDGEDTWADRAADVEGGYNIFKRGV